MPVIGIELFGLGLLVGMLIGCLGVGGVILVPAMSLGLGIPVAAAGAAAMFGYLASGLLGTILLRRRGSLDTQIAIPVCLAAAPGSAIGVWLVSGASPWLVQSFVALFAGVMGLEGMLRRPKPPTDRAPPHYASAAIGAGVGLISALSGTGGPRVLVPLMLTLGATPPHAIGLAQVVQIPIAMAASSAAAALGVLDLTLAAPLAIGLACGSVVGVRAFHRITPNLLRTMACLILVATSIAIGMSLLNSR